MSDTKSYEPLYRLRHSASHILAQAVLDLYPGTKLAIGPVIDEGFYYDFDSKTAFQDEDLPKIEARMREIVKERQPFKEWSVPKSEALKIFGEKQECYKTEIIEGIPGDTVNFVQNGPFTDLCEGGHIANTEELKAFKLLSVAGAYWRGSEKNPMLQRIYGTAFLTQKELDAHVTQREEALKRDHRKVGKQLGLFSFHEEGPGLPFWKPQGLILKNLLIAFMREKLAVYGYTEIETPTILRDKLWRTSGHWDNYRENMFFLEREEEVYALKPMNCPGGMLMYKEEKHSYRELPLKVAEFGKVHRYERSGVLAGLSVSVDSRRTMPIFLPLPRRCKRASWRLFTLRMRYTKPLILIIMWSSRPGPRSRPERTSSGRSRPRGSAARLTSSRCPTR